MSMSSIRALRGLSMRRTWSTVLSGRHISSSSLLLSYPPHELHPMPALSPTMEAGSIASWLVKEGGAFSAGQALCEVQTDKATVTFDAQDDGYLAKILVGSDEVQVGQPIMITVEEKSDVAAFANYVVSASTSAPPAAPPAAPAPVVPAAPTSAPVAAVTTSTSSGSGSGRVVASPLAKKLARDAGVTLHTAIEGSGPGGRIVAADVMKFIASGGASAPVVASESSSATATSVSDNFAGIPAGMSILPSNAAELAAHLTRTKQTVPHYYLSVEVNMEKLLHLRSTLNSDMDGSGIAVTDFIIKACGVAMKAVPDINGEWKDSYVRQYEQVDINIVMGAGSKTTAPVIRDVGSKGLKEISNHVGKFEDAIFGEDGQVLDAASLGRGTFSIHNLGNFIYIYSFLSQHHRHHYLYIIYANDRVSFLESHS